MRQQVPDRDPRRVGRRVAEGLQLRNVSLGRIVERQLARITELENRHRREALGHRCDAKDRVCVDRRFGLDVAHAHRALVRELAIDHDAPRRAGRMDRGRVVREDFVDVRKRRREFGAAVGRKELAGRLPGKMPATCGKVCRSGTVGGKDRTGWLRHHRGCDGDEDQDCEPLAHGRILQQVVVTHDAR